MLSIVIPTLDAELHLGACIASVKDADEIVVVDGGSSDYTIEVAARFEPKLLCAARGRGRQLAAGAEAAEGDWLLFLHADTVLSAGWREAAERHMGAEPDKAGCFRFRLDAGEWQARVLERGVAQRARLLGLPYGDQGLLVSRTLYESVGGYKPLPIMEDVDLVTRIGQGRMCVLDADAVTSAARWRRRGWFRQSARNLGLLGLYCLGVSPARIADLYSPRP